MFNRVQENGLGPDEAAVHGALEATHGHHVAAQHPVDHAAAEGHRQAQRLTPLQRQREAAAAVAAEAWELNDSIKAIEYRTTRSYILRFYIQ